MTCGDVSSRFDLQGRLREANGPWIAEYCRTSTSSGEGAVAEQRADGDAELRADAEYGSLVLPRCSKCAPAGRPRRPAEGPGKREGAEDRLGLLKPNVVFFGDNVPKATVEFCHSQVDAADAILVVGSSLEVYSAFRFIERALVMDPQDGEEEEREQQQQRRPKRRRPTVATKPICVLNLGATRADRAGIKPLLRVNLPCDEALWESVVVAGGGVGGGAGI